MTSGSGGEVAGYDAHATARFAPEPAKRAGSPERGPFQRDRARVLHSSALRRLAAKTQVVEVGQADFPRTRLTHSLECAQVGRELGAALGCDPDLVDAACLAHDLGHPPFGHNGETALAQVAAGCGGFEGNAQSLRLLTRLEPKIPGAALNLTRATLDATLKYPWLASAVSPSSPSPASAPSPAPPRIDGPSMAPEHHQWAIDGPADGYPGAKFGCYDDDAEVFRWVRQGAPSGRACLEAQVMDWADDVAYSVHDLEDGLHSGLITLTQLRDPQERRQVAELSIAQYLPPGSVTAGELCDVFDRLLTLDCWPQRFDGEPQTVAAVKNLTSELIGRFCGAAERATRPAGSPPLRRYACDLEVPRRQRLECALLKGVTAFYVMRRHGADASQAREREVLTELVGALLAGAPAALDPLFRPEFESAGSDAARLRVVVDQVASLTDISALAWHARLCG
ncbi:MAG TPA: deoxyguanosinetriphosphate triphosphohydrolase [Streptosporangiaceae bacterium]